MQNARQKEVKVMSAFYYHDSIFLDAVEESTAKALNVLSTARVEGIRVEVIFNTDDTSITYNVRMPALLNDAKISAFYAAEVSGVMNALRVLFQPASEKWTHYRTTDDKGCAVKCRTRTIHLGMERGSKVVYINLFY